MRKEIIIISTAFRMQINTAEVHMSKAVTAKPQPLIKSMSVRQVSAYMMWGVFSVLGSHSLLICIKVS